MGERRYFFRLYFSTHQHIYVLPYQRQKDKQDSEPPLPARQAIEFVRPLTEMAFTGATWVSILDRAGDDLIWPLLYVPQRYDPYSLGQIEAIFSQKTRLPVKNTILIRRAM